MSHWDSLFFLNQYYVDEDGWHFLERVFISNKIYLFLILIKFQPVKSRIISILFLLIVSNRSSAQLKVTFSSLDSVTVTADWYPIDSKAPTIILCHQADYSRGEYIESALKLNKYGFNCLAIDQRSGDEVNGITNETAKDAKSKKKHLEYADAEQDIIAAVSYVFEKEKTPVILLGSSYSASLVLKIANENDHVKAAVAFSPGEYFEDKNWVTKKISGLRKSCFITSSLDESADVTKLCQDVISTLKIQYIPKTKGDHGSKVLWSSAPEHEQYWIALMSFLMKVKRDMQ